jgi:molybdopterin synthase sulfur carrier subunit
MKINILAFGQIATVTGHSLVVEDSAEDTDTLKNVLSKEYPALKNLNFSIAVDKKIIHENVQLQDNITVALLPPFSGG